MCVRANSVGRRMRGGRRSRCRIPPMRWDRVGTLGWFCVSLRPDAGAMLPLRAPSRRGALAGRARLGPSLYNLAVALVAARN